MRNVLCVFSSSSALSIILVCRQWRQWIGQPANQITPTNVSWEAANRFSCQPISNKRAHSLNWAWPLVLFSEYKCCTRIHYTKRRVPNNNICSAVSCPSILHVVHTTTSSLRCSLCSCASSIFYPARPATNAIAAARLKKEITEEREEKKTKLFDHDLDQYHSHMREPKLFSFLCSTCAALTFSLYFPPPPTTIAELCVCCVLRSTMTASIQLDIAL